MGPGLLAVGFNFRQSAVASVAKEEAFRQSAKASERRSDGGSLQPLISNLGILNARGIGMVSTINKASVPFLAIVMVIIAAIAAKVRATINAQVPEGYEDETGFHFGHPDFKNSAAPGWLDD